MGPSGPSASDLDTLIWATWPPTPIPPTPADLAGLLLTLNGPRQGPSRLGGGVWLVRSAPAMWLPLSGPWGHPGLG
jgi:hypothetical protein